jgi:hypothetical protein
LGVEISIILLEQAFSCSNFAEQFVNAEAFRLLPFVRVHRDAQDLPVTPRLRSLNTKLNHYCNEAPSLVAVIEAQINEEEQKIELLEAQIAATNKRIEERGATDRKSTRGWKTK